MSERASPCADNEHGARVLLIRKGKDVMVGIGRRAGKGREGW